MAQQKETKTVLVLHSLSQGFPATIQWDRVIRSEFSSQQEYEVIIYTEHLDFSKFHDDSYIEKMKDLFKYKYQNEQPDLIMTVFEPAFDFVFNFKAELFPEVPLVYGGVERNSIKDRIENPLFSGVSHEKKAFTETLNLIERLHPERKELLVICGTGYFESAWLKAAKKTFEEYAGNLEFTYLQGVSVETLKKTLGEANEGQVVLFFPIFEDLEGNNYVAADIIPVLSESSAVPMYSFWELAVNGGCIGGYVIDFTIEASEVSELGLGILTGTSEGLSQHLLNKGLRYIFNARQLKRWSIPVDQLPEESEIRNQEISFFEKYFFRIILITALVILQSLVIGYLIVQRRTLRRSKLELKLAEQKYRTVANYTYDWEYWQNPDGSLQWVSPSCERVSGYDTEEILSNPAIIENMIFEPDREVWRNHSCRDSASNGVKEVQFRIITAEGAMKWIEHTCQAVVDPDGQYLGVRANNRDITLRQEFKSKTSLLQSELIHIERVATMNTLSYSLAHELNQPLSSIRSFTQAAQRFMKKGDMDQVEKALNSIVSENKRAATIIDHLRKMVKKEKALFKEVNLNSIVKKALMLLKKEIDRSHVAIEQDLDRHLPEIKGNEIQLQQVLLNLMINSLHSIENQGTKEGIIKIASFVDPSGQVVLEISDNGVGIEEEQLEPIFEPFHSTKSKGMGLGLAISRLIVESHGGQIRAENNAVGGAVFSISFPSGGRPS